MHNLLKERVKRIMDQQSQYLTETEKSRIQNHVEEKFKTNSRKEDKRKVKEPEFYVSKFFK